MSYSISKDFEFCASHHLDGLPEGHKCARGHGHNYTVRVVIEAAELDDVGMVLDYGALAPFGRWIDESLDHRRLNDEMTVNPTAENLACLLYHVLWDVVPELAEEAPSERWGAVEIGVQETPKTWAWYGR